jgi:c-di-GMP-binding flagellar brake protein YcgR
MIQGNVSGGEPMEQEIQKIQEPKRRYGTVDFERRKYPRVKISLTVEYYRIDSSMRQTGRTSNASEGGLEIYVPEQMEVGDQLKLKIYFSSGDELRTVDAVAEVVWTDLRLGEAWGEYRSGVKFVEISSDDLQKLKDFLMSFTK